jgi:thiol-disulfide isomerase/thioredoxin
VDPYNASPIQGRELLKAATDTSVSARKEVKDAKTFTTFLEAWHVKLDALAAGEMLLVQGGWTGLTTSSTVMHIVECTGDATFSFVTCNSGSGLSYHPSSPAADAPKLKQKTCIRLDNVPSERMLDPAFWCMLFTLWVKDPPSEFHRVEVVYDVLLPWLAGKLLPAALAETGGDAYAEWRTPERSNTSSTKSVIEALRYMYRRLGLSTEQLKQLMFNVRREMVARAGVDLMRLVDPQHGHTRTYVEWLADTGGGATPQLVQPGTGGPASHGAAGMATTVADALANQEIVGLYFSGGWCEPCQQFTPTLVAAYNAVRAAGGAFQVVFVSMDRDADQFRRYHATMPWPALPFERRDTAKALADQFVVKSIPTLILFDRATGRIVNLNGVETVAKDKAGVLFPWRAPPPTLDQTDVELLRVGCAQLANAALKASERGHLPLPQLTAVRAEIDGIDELVRMLPHASTDEGMPPPLRAEALAPAQPYAGVGLLVGEGQDAYAGTAKNAPPPLLANFLDVPVRAASFKAAMAAMEACDAACTVLLERATNGGASSRLVIQYEVIAFIGSVFTDVLPLPLHDAASVACIWQQALPKTQQLRVLELLHTLLLTYGSMWQSIETPTRAFDAERGVVAAAMFCIFDAVLRTPAADAPLHVTELLCENGGTRLSTTVCQNSREFLTAAVSMELTRPAHAVARAAALDYLQALEARSPRTIFDFRMPEKLEIKKYGTTVRFLRRLMERCGYELTQRNNRNPPPEMESLMEWLLGERTPLAQHDSGRAFYLARDVTFLFKFLATMETREMEQMRRRTAVREWQRWTLSFDQGGHRGGYFRGMGERHKTPLRWEAVNFRGLDIDTADVSVFGLSGRKLLYGEGPVVQSPADAAKMLQLEAPTEDDVLHADSLADYAHTLSVEESQLLMSYLTVDCR